MKKLFVVILVVLFGVSIGFACVIDPKDTTIIYNGGQGGQGGVGGQGGAGGAGGTGIGGSATATGGSATASTGPVSQSVSVESQRDMAAGVFLGSILTDLQFKYGKHTGDSDSRISENPNEVIEQLSTLELQEAIRGKGAKGDVKIIDSLIRPQFYKTTSIETLPKGTTPIDKNSRYLGSITAVAATNDVNFENVVCAAAEFGMENGATHMVMTKTSFTEWGDTTGYSFELMPFITSIIGGAGKNAVGVGGGAGAGMNTMTGGSSDRPDAAFKFFVDEKTLKANSEKSQKK